MHISTTRFGRLTIDVDDLLHFPHGVIGFEECRQWVLLADPQSPIVGWLQSAQRPSTALAVVSPRRFAPDYRIRLHPGQLNGLALDELDRLFALCVVARKQDDLTMNLRAPLLINLDRRLGCQVITVDDQPLQAAMPKSSSQLRKSA